MKKTPSHGSRARKVAALACAGLLATVLTACGDGSDEGKNLTDKDAAGLTEAATLAQQYQTPPTAIGPDQPVKGTIPTGKKIFVIDAGPGAQGVIHSNNAFEDAAEVLGWQVTRLSPKVGPLPDEMQPFFDQAIQAKPDAVIIGATDINAAGIADKIAELTKNGTEVVAYYGAEDAEDGGLAAQVFGLPRFFELTAAVADTALAGAVDDCKGGEKCVFGWVGIEGYSVIEAYSGSFKDEIARLCPSCAVKDLTLTIDDLVQQTAGTKVTTFLRSNPDIKGLTFGYDGAARGLSTAAEAEGIELPALYSVGPEAGALPEIRDGVLSGAPVFSPEVGWHVADTLARLFAGDDSAAEMALKNPAPVVWSKAADNIPADPPAGQYPDGFAGYQDQYKKLWGK